MSEPVPPDAEPLPDETSEGRRSRILDVTGARRRITRNPTGRRRPRKEGRRAVLTALISTLVFFTALVLVVVNSPNWPAVKNQFFNGAVFRESFPGILRAFWINVKLFMTAEIFILPFALLLAVMRSTTGPVFFPIRALAIGYIDFFRGVPTILVIYILGFGMPASKSFSITDYKTICEKFSDHYPITCKIFFQ